tara:strand:+ start:507 stop:1298 length:792 start_codon:yes stop_codon:yes gene_type:complete
MKKYFVIGNPIDHSLSPKLHNYWLKNLNIEAIYEKKKLKESDIENIILKIRNEHISGINVTVPFKKKIIPFLDELTLEANETQSVNTICKVNNKIVGYNTDVIGFELALKSINYETKGKKVLILGSGGVVPSIIFTLKKMKASKIILSNRTKKNAEELKKIFPELEIINWGEITDFNMIINATSLGLKEDDEIKINYDEIGGNKLFYDLIYNPKQTKFLLKAQEFGHQTVNGKMMFIYQAHQAFTIWHKIMPKIDEEIISLLD